jgi:hypothetical protein
MKTDIDEEVRKLTWDHETQRYVPADSAKKHTKNGPEMKFFKLPYELSVSSRIPVLAVLAELSLRQFKALDKKEPIKLGNVKLKKLGITPKVKVRALKQLEAAGIIKIQ